MTNPLGSFSVAGPGDASVAMAQTASIRLRRTTSRIPARTVAGLTLAVSVLASGCNRGDIGFDIPTDVSEQTIPGNAALHAAAVAAEQSGNTAAQSVRFESGAEARSTEGLAIVELRSFELTITNTAVTSGDADCWDFVRSATVSIASTNPDTKLQSVPIADAQAPGCVQVLSFVPRPDVDLRPYIEEGYRVITDAVAIPPGDDVTFTGKVIVRAGLF